MKVFAVIPALLVLVSLCGSPVPLPPGSVSGTVYYDANHNGIHDSCDGPLGGVNVQATGSDGKTETTTADTSAAVVRSDALRNFHQVVRGLGGDPESLLAKSQIESAALENRHAVVSYRMLVHLLERAASCGPGTSTAASR